MKVVKTSSVNVADMSKQHLPIWKIQGWAEPDTESMIVGMQREVVRPRLAHYPQRCRDIRVIALHIQSDRPSHIVVLV